jgi:potassium/chloride transporter 4/5/6
MSGAILFGSSVHEMFLRDKFGASAYGRLSIAELAVPHPTVILVGCLMSTIGAGMQSLTGAPRLLQAIAKDGVIPGIGWLSWSTKAGEPLKAVLVTLCICEIGILIAQLESITALITQFFLMCYCGVNTACALQSILKAPSWRPSFRYYHWWVRWAPSRTHSCVQDNVDRRCDTVYLCYVY